MSKPTNKPGWGATGVEPSSTKKSQGWSAGEKPAAEHFNWLMKTVSEWIEHVDADQVKGDTGDAGPQGEKGATGDAGPSGSAALDATTEARIAALESKAKISTPSSVTMALSYQGTGVASEYNAGNSGSAITVDWSNGVSQAVIVNDNTTVSFANPTSGKVYYLCLKSDGVADRNLTFVGANPSISSISNGYTAIISLYYDGSAYVVQKITALFGPVSGSETKKGYVAGGVTGGVSGGSAITSIQKIDFNVDTIITTVQSQFSSRFNATGGYASQQSNSHISNGQGTQSSTHGYCDYQGYNSLPTVNNNTSICVSKMAFATDSGQVTTIRPINTSLWHGANRRSIVQSADNAYKHYNSASFAKMAFSTDAFSSVTLASGIGNAVGYNIGMSTASVGYTWGVTGALTSGYKLAFATETASAASTTSSYSTNDSGGWGEAVDGSDAGYVQKTTSATSSGTVRCYKMLKSTDVWSTLVTSLTGAGAGASATQGNACGYFCGGQNATSIGTSTVGQNTIKRIIMASDAYAVSGTTLAQNQAYAAGFEG